MNVIAISTLSPHHQYVLANVHKRWPLRLVIQPIWAKPSSQQSRLAKFIKSPTKTVGRRFNTTFYNWIDRKRNRAIAGILDEYLRREPLDVPRRGIPTTEINSEQTAALIRKIAPDVILTSGCPLLHRRIFGIARLATINVHWGIAPNYRGENSLFWPLYFRDYDNIGITFHQIDDGIDTGPIFAHAFPDLSSDDTEAALFTKSAQLAATLLPEVLEQTANRRSIQECSAQTPGRLFLKRERSMRHDIAYWLSRKVGRVTIPKSPERTQVYLGNQQSQMEETIQN